jgi:hypothetical protein
MWLKKWRKGRQVTKFVDLFDNSRHMHGDERRRSVRPLVLELAQENGFRSWAVGDGIPSDGTRLLIGVVDWSRYDFEVLDAICRSDKFRFLDIFMLDDCKAQSEIEAFIPGVTPVFQSPVIGMWEHGTLVAKAKWFAAAKQVIAAYETVV